MLYEMIALNELYRLFFGLKFIRPSGRPEMAVGSLSPKDGAECQGRFTIKLQATASSYRVASKRKIVERFPSYRLVSRLIVQRPKLRELSNWQREKRGKCLEYKIASFQ